MDFALTGSPCHPFSQQRDGRFASTSVQKHGEYETTMSSLLQWTKCFEPKCWIMEQVMGFDMPFVKKELSPDCQDTPLSRQLVCLLGLG